MRPHSLMKHQAPNKIPLHVEPVVAVHVPDGVAAARQSFNAALGTGAPCIRRAFARTSVGIMATKGHSRMAGDHPHAEPRVRVALSSQRLRVLYGIPFAPRGRRRFASAAMTAAR
jgi:hypothetical protein